MRQRLIFISVCLLMAGCTQQPDSGTPVAQSGPAGKPVTAPAEPTIKIPEVNAADLPADREVWTGIYMPDGEGKLQKVGHSRIAERLYREGGEQYRHQHGRSEVTMLREGRSITQKIDLQTWADSSGRVVRFESRIGVGGPGDIVASGRAGQGGMIVTTTTQGKMIKRFIPWPENCDGYFAVENSLEREPLRAGETRTVAGLIPAFNLPGETTLTALEEEDVDIRGLTQRLLKIKNEIKIPDVPEPIISYCWTNSRGETIKRFEPSFKQEDYRTTKEIALRADDIGQIDLLESTTVKLKGTLQLPKDGVLARAEYIARLKDGTFENQFWTDEFQQVEKIDGQSLRIKVRRIDPTRKVDEKLRGEKPTPEELAPNGLIQSDDHVVRTLADSVVPGQNDPEVVAKALERAVRTHIHKRNYGVAFATAAEVARTQEGDCTEHAVLLAAVCRARKIPARVVLGLVYYPKQSGFAYHMWNEVWVGSRWLPLDATVAQGAVGADHIKLRHSSLHGETAYAVMMSLLQVVNRLELEVVPTSADGG
jgi:hypothetical protein